MRALAILVVMIASVVPMTGQERFTRDDLVAADRLTIALYRERNYEKALEAADRELVIARALSVDQAVRGTLYNKSCILALLGRGDEAADALQGAVDAGYTNYLNISMEEDFTSIRQNPRFAAVIARLREAHGLQPLKFDSDARPVPFPVRLDPVDLVELTTLRNHYQLDQVVADSETDYQKLLRITEWTSRQWQHSSTGMASKTDPLTILKEAREGGRFICRDYAIVTAGAARSLGMPSRLLGLLPKDVETRSEAHSVAEVWLEQFDKWVIADGQFGIVPEIEGVPLSAVELQAAIAREDPNLKCNRQDVCTRWKKFIYPNMYYFKIARDQRRFHSSDPWQLVLVPAGSRWPRAFAGANEEIFNGAFYSSSLESFYQPPPRTQ